MAKKKRFLLASCLTAVLAASLTAGISAIASANNQEGWSEVTFEQEYDYKSVFTVTDRTFTLDGNSYDADFVVCYPDGSTSSNKELVLNQTGVYTVKYCAKAGDKMYAESEQFLVNYPMYDVSNEKSSVAYGTPAGATTAGVMAKMASGDSLTFTQYIDFTKVTSNDKLLTMYVTPDVAGAADFLELTLKFTDSVDPSVFFEVHYYGYDWTYNTYVAANGNNQVPTGMHQSEGLKKNNGYGAWCYNSFNSKGQNGIAAPDASLLYLSMDYENMQLYTQGFPSVTWMIADLNDKNYFDQVWTGFPSGKARLTISGGAYVASSASICVTSVFGIDDLSQNVYYDADKPTISVDDTYDEMPIGVVGYNYTIPDATAFDSYARECDVEVAVWYNYGQEKMTNVTVTDGKFAIDRAGTYGIEYIARDKVGNETREVKWVRGYEQLDKAVITIPEEKITVAKTGDWVLIPEISDDCISGGSGKSTVTAFTEINGKREAIDGGFRAMQVGTYKVIYVATDYVGQTSEAYYEVTIEEGNIPVLERNYDVYPAYISGGTYPLPAYYAYHYENGKMEKLLCDVKVTDGQGVNTYKAGQNAVIKVKENGDPVHFDILCVGEKIAEHDAVGVLSLVESSDKKKVLTVENFLVGDGFTAEKMEGKSGLLLKAVETDKIAYTFANALSARYVKLSVCELLGAKSNTVLRVTISDVLDKTNCISATIGLEGNQVYLEVDGKRVILSGASFGAEGSFDITYQNKAFTVNGVTLELSSFAGFETDKAFVSVSYENCANNAQFVFFSIGNETFSTGTRDRGKPEIFSEYDLGGSHLPGDTFVLYAPIAYDVFAPNVVYTLTVSDPSGQPIRDINGVLLENADPTKDYVIKLDDIGRYSVNYSIEEAAEFVSKPNPQPFDYTLNVVDKIAPTIEWKGEFVTTLNVGEVFIVPEYVVSDNYNTAEELGVAVYVETPVHQLFMLPGNSIQMTHVGEYKIRVMVVDKTGNITTEIYFVEVK